MSSIPLPALYLRPPQQQESPLDQATRLVQLRSLLNAQPYQQQILQQQAQAGALENQQRQLQMQQQRALADLYSRGSSQNADAGASPAGASAAAAQPPAATRPQHAGAFDMPSDDQILASGGPVYGMQILRNMKELQKTNIEMKKAMLEHQATMRDYLGSVAHRIQQSGYDPMVAGQLLDQTAGAIPDLGPQIAQVRGQIQNPAMLRQIVDGIVAQSPEQRRVAAEEATAGARGLAARYKMVNGTLMDMSGKAPKPAVIGPMDAQAWSDLVDKVVPQTDANAALNLRTKGEVSFYAQKGDAEKAADALTRAGQQVGTIEKEAGPVLMRAPDGQTKPVPTDRVEHYKNLGAAVVGDQQQ